MRGSGFLDPTASLELVLRLTTCRQQKEDSESPQLRLLVTISSMSLRLWSNRSARRQTNGGGADLGSALPISFEEAKKLVNLLRYRLCWTSLAVMTVRSQQAKYSGFKLLKKEKRLLNNLRVMQVKRPRKRG